MSVSNPIEQNFRKSVQFNTGGELRRKSEVSEASDTMVGQHDPSSLRADLARALEYCEGADLNLVVGEVLLPANSFLLSIRSPVLAAMLQRSTSDGGVRHVVLPDIDEDVARLLLTFIYTDQVPTLGSLAPQLLAASDKYDLPLLRQKCEQQLLEGLSINNAATAVVLSVQHACTQLKERAVEIIRDHAVEVMATESWQQDLCSHPELAAEVSRLVGASSTFMETRSLTGKPSVRLLEAAKDGVLGEVEAMLEAGMNVNTTDDGGSTALHFATCHGHLETVKCLLDSGAEVGARDDNHDTPLHWAAGRGHVGVVKLLMASAADPNVRGQYGMTPLHWAALCGHGKSVKGLLEAGAEKAPKDVSGSTPLDLAKRGNHQQVVDMLS